MFLVKILTSLGQRTEPWETTGETLQNCQLFNVFAVYFLFSLIQSVLKWLCMLQWYEHKAAMHFEIFQLRSPGTIPAKMEPNVRKVSLLIKVDWQ